MPNEDGFIKYFIPIFDQQSRVECIYPVSGIDKDSKETIRKLEEFLKNTKNEQH